MAEFRISIPSLPDPTLDTYTLPAFFSPIQELEVIVYKTTNTGVLDSVTINVTGALIESTGTNTETAYITQSYDAYPLKIIIDRGTLFGNFDITISAISNHTVYVEGRRSSFSCPKTLNMIGEANVDNTIGFDLKNLDQDNSHFINISDNFPGNSSIGIYHSSVRAIEELNNFSIPADRTLHMRFIVRNADVQNTTITITIIDANTPGDTLTMTCTLDVVDSLKLYGDSMVRRLFAEEVLSSTVRVGGAKIMFDEAAQRIRFMINDKEQSTLSTSSAFVPDMIEHDSQNPKSRVKITPTGEVQMMSISPTGVETIALEMDLSGKLRIQSGIAFVPSILNKNTDNDFVLNINTDSGSPALEVKNGDDIKLRVEA